MTEQEYREAQRESDAYYDLLAVQDEFYEWLSAFEFCQRTLDRMSHDQEAIESGAVEMFIAFLQKQCEQREMIVRCH